MKNSFCYLQLGGNIGDTVLIFERTRKLISKHIGPITKASSLYETEPWGKKEQNSFLNQVIMVETTLNAESILKFCLSIEKELGRVRFQEWGERVIDIDILYYNHDIITSKNLTIPHPYIEQRNFVLYPMAELAPEFMHPVIMKTQQELLNLSPDDSECKKIEHFSADSTLPLNLN